MTAEPRPTASGFFDEIGRALRHWPAVLISGIITVVAGILALAWPGATLLALSILFGVGILFQGIAFSGIALAEAPKTPGRVWLGVWGVISTIIGVIALIHPWAAAIGLAYLLIVWFLVDAVHNFARAATVAESRIWFGLLGVVEIIVAVWLTIDLSAALETVVYVAAFGFLLRGGAEIALALRLRHVGKVLDGQSAHEK